MPDKKEVAKARNYYWIAINRLGARAHGKIIETSLTRVKDSLREQGFTAIEVSTNPLMRFQLFKNRIRSEDITLMTRLLSTLFGSGISLIQCLDSILLAEDNRELKALLQTIRDDVDAGSSLSKALRKHPEYFDELYCNLVDAGEQSGTLDVMLERVAKHQEEMANIKSKIKKALVYPVFVISAALIISFVILIFVVPQFEALFAASNAEFPFVTKVVINLSKFLQSNWWIILIGIIAVVWELKHLLKTSKKFAGFFDRAILRLPIIGIIIRKAIIARFAQTLQTCFDSGMPIVDSLTQSAAVTGNIVYQEGILGVRDEVKVGQPLHASITNTGLFPIIVTKMISAGEESGSLASMLGKIADFYGAQVNYAVDNLSALLEPVIIVILGVVIGGLIIALYLPIFQMGLAL